MKLVHEPPRDIPVVEEKEVVVAGGGMAGVAAAVAAARAGAHVLLIERYGFLGGMATAALVDTIPPVAKGIGTEIKNRISDLGGISTERRFWSSWDPEAIKRVCLDIIEESHVDLLLHTLIVGTIVEERKVSGVILESKSGRTAVLGNVLVDATGDGDVAAKSGAQFLYGDKAGKTLPMTLMFNLRNVDKSRGGKFLNPSIKEFVKRAIKEGTKWEIGLDQYEGQPGVCAAPMVESDEVSIWGGVIEDLKAIDVNDLTKAERLARKHVPILVEVLRKYVPGFENATVKDTAAQIGVRESRRIIGNHYLTLDEARAGGRYEDAIGRLDYGNWHYWVPYGILVPKDCRGILNAGRCVSADREVLYIAGLREIPGAMLTGEAAGTAAALCVRSGKDPKDLNISDLQERLVKQGALQLTIAR
jgi:hypothetical protein